MMRPQLARSHRRQHQAREPHAAQHVDLEEAAPVVVGNLLERLGFEDAEVVDEDLDARVAVHDVLGGARASLRSPAKPSTCPPGPGLIDATAASTDACARPLTMTRAPSAASAAAMA